MERFNERLALIPQDPEDPESLEDMVVCAFGAFERYYVCWKTRGGDYRQDGYDLPESLQEWLFPTDGTSRDFASLQVVFGRGEEYFASDKNGKLEFKEPEKPETPVDEKPSLRRSRTISMIRPLSGDSGKDLPFALDLQPQPASEASLSRSSSLSRTSSRPPSMSFLRAPFDPTSNSVSAIAVESPASSRRSSILSQRQSRPGSTSSTEGSPEAPTPSDSPVREPPPSKETLPEPPPIPPTRPLVRRATRPLSLSFKAGSFPKIDEGKTLSPNNRRDSDGEVHCSCCRHNPDSKPHFADSSLQTEPEPKPLPEPKPAPQVLQLASTITSSHTEPEVAPEPVLASEPAPAPQVLQFASVVASVQTAPLTPPSAATTTPPAPLQLKSFIHSDASMQTDPEPLKINTATAARDSGYGSISYRSSLVDYDTPLTDDIAPAMSNPVYMGRMFDYFGNPGYQLGDSLVSSYHYFQQPSYQESFYEQGWK